MVSVALSLKRLLIGRPIPTAEEQAHRLSKRIALPVFSSDAISSTAYATEEILIVLFLAGSAALHLAIPIAVGIAALLAIVAVSYEQTVHAYPNGGGSYIVGKDNLGTVPGLVAASSLLVDYVMTVAVSVASGVAAIASAFPGLFAWRVLIAVVLVLLVAIANLRGLRESGRLFSIPTYSFILLCSGLIVVGLIRWATGTLHPIPHGLAEPAARTMGLFLILRAFSAGCSAMTGTEAISNGVPAFKPPESRNAGITLGIMAAILGTFLIGVTWLSHVLDVWPKLEDTVLSQVGRSVYGNGTVLYFALQIATMAILIIAANTSFADFPRLSSILARDGFMPRQFQNRGDRLVFSNGVIGLALISIVLIVIFQANVTRMIPLYAVGVFTSFTISQAGMVVHWYRLRESESGWRWRAVMNGVGAVSTAIVSVVIMATKLPEGAWIVLIAIPALVVLFHSIHRHYERVGRLLRPQGPEELAELGRAMLVEPRTTVVLFVSQVNAVVARSLYLAKALGEADTRAVTIKGEDATLDMLEEQWAEIGTDVPLEVVESPYRELVRPAVKYIRSLEPGPDHMVVVVIPEFVVDHWWHAFLHNQNALRLRGALFLVPWVVVVSIPLRVGSAEQTFAPVAVTTPRSREASTAKPGGGRLRRTAIRRAPGRRS